MAITTAASATFAGRARTCGASREPARCVCVCARANASSVCVLVEQNEQEYNNSFAKWKMLT